MITEYDERVNTGNFKEAKKAGKEALNYIRKHFMEYAKPPEIRGYSHTFSPYTFRDVFDEQISKHGFEIDARTHTHAYGIGNNNRWDIVDSEMNKVGEFRANNNMYQGVYINVSIKDEHFDGFEICSGGFIREKK